jgi:hypothetical protein
MPLHVLHFETVPNDKRTNHAALAVEAVIVAMIFILGIVFLT